MRPHAYGAVLVTALLAGCGATGPSAPAPDSASVPPSPAASAVPSSGPFDAYMTDIGAANIALMSCIGRFNVEETEWCPGTFMSDLVHDVTAPLAKDLAVRPDPARFADVTAAISDLDRSADAAREPCDDIPARKLSCLAAFDTLMNDWHTFTAATGY